MFTCFNHDVALIGSGGVFRTAPLFTGPDSGLYIGLGSGCVRVRADGSTSKDKVSVYKIETSKPLYHDKYQRLSTAKTAGCTGPHTFVERPL